MVFSKPVAQDVTPRRGTKTKGHPKQLFGSTPITSLTPKRHLTAAEKLEVCTLFHRRKALRKSSQGQFSDRQLCAQLCDAYKDKGRISRQSIRRWYKKFLDQENFGDHKTKHKYISDEVLEWGKQEVFNMQEHTHAHTYHINTHT